MKSELGIRPLYHQLGRRVEAHILVPFLAYCLFVTLKNRLQALAPGLTPWAVLEELSTIQMLEVWLPTTDGRWLVMPALHSAGGGAGDSATQTQARLAAATTATDKSSSPEFPQEALRMQCRPFDRFIENQGLRGFFIQPYCERQA